MPSERSRRVVVALVLLALLLVAVVAAPFAPALLVAGTLAAALLPLQERLERLLRGRPRLAAGLLTTAVVLVLLIPLATLVGIAVKQIAEGVAFVSQTLQSEGVDGLVQTLPGPLQGAARRLLHALPGLVRAGEGLVREHGGEAAQAVGGVIVKGGSLLLQTAMMLVAFFFLLVDGRRLVAWIESVSPLKSGQASEILAEFRKVAVAVVVSSLATAALQAGIALVGYLIARVPQPFFFLLLTFFFGLIPAIGAGGACLAAAGLVLLTGRGGAAAFLALWAIFVVGLADNVLKPLLLRGDQFHGAVVFFALLGGLAVFGPTGLIAGPLILALLMALLRIYRRDYREAG